MSSEFKVEVKGLFALLVLRPNSISNVPAPRATAAWGIPGGGITSYVNAILFEALEG